MTKVSERAAPARRRSLAASHDFLQGHEVRPNAPNSEKGKGFLGGGLALSVARCQTEEGEGGRSPGLGIVAGPSLVVSEIFHDVIVATNVDTQRAEVIRCRDGRQIQPVRPKDELNAMKLKALNCRFHLLRASRVIGGNIGNWGWVPQLQEKVIVRVKSSKEVVAGMRARCHPCIAQKILSVQKSGAATGQVEKLVPADLCCDWIAYHQAEGCVINHAQKPPSFPPCTLQPPAKKEKCWETHVVQPGPCRGACHAEK